MKRTFFSFVTFVLFFFSFANISFAQQVTPPSSLAMPDIFYERARVIAIKKEYTKDFNGFPNTYQSIQFRILDGKDKDTIITEEVNIQINSALRQKLQSGEIVVLTVEKDPTGKELITVSDRFRLNKIYYLLFAFAFFIILLTGKKGVGAILGLGISLGIILLYIIPQILNHQDPLQISITGAFIILFSTTFLAHGFSKKTVIAVTATFISLCITYLIGIMFVNFARLAGLGTEDSYLLELTPGQSINPKGLLFGGIIIGTLGALNDITTTQVAAIFALVKSNPKQPFSHLVTQGLSIGREHILSLVNTLVLAYAGTSLPVFVFMVLNPQRLPYWTLLNSESMSEEIVRSVVGSLGLMLAVPIATILASYFALQFASSKKENKT